ncbi:isocitrate lyase/PEP mutase family protein [Streptomyces sp. NPDC005549]|uniref:isocitrate lyase/PEP mutase family protein n=1 Tax=Streptomyces sp. NPDC005549 TaxID=3154888 RepID=UPI0033B30451
MLDSPGLVVGAGAHDAMTAKIVQLEGFPLCFVTGAGISMTHGYADVGLMTMSEVANACSYVTQAVDIPCVADADNGYGNAINMMRTVRTFEQVGLAGIHFEDQESPKRCGHMTGKKLISKDEMVQKIRAAQDARRDPNFVIMARCDALTVNGIDDCLERGEAYLEAGADVLWFEMRKDMDEIDALTKPFAGRAKLHYNHSSSGGVPRLSLDEIEAKGFKTVGYHAHTTHAAAKTMLEVLREIRKTGNTETVWDRIGGFEEFYNIGGLQEIRELEKKYVS